MSTPPKEAQMDRDDAMRLLEDLNRRVAAGDYEGALPLSLRLEKHFREQGEPVAQASCWSGAAESYRRRGDTDAAMAAFQRCVDLLHAAGRDADLDSSTRQFLRAALGNLADMLHAKGSLTEALPLYQEMAEVARSLGELYWAQAALNNQGFVLWKLGRLPEAIEAFTAQSKLAEEIDNYPELVKSLCCRAQVHIQQGTRLEAAQDCRRALEIVQRHGLHPLLPAVAGLMRSIGLS